MEIVRHIFDAQRGMEIMDVRDSHGREAQFQCGILPGNPEPSAFFQQRIDEFAEQENHLKEHIKKFVPKVLLILLILFLAPLAHAAPTITVSASAVTILGTTQTISITVQLIDPLNTGMLKVSGTGIIPIMRASTVTPGTTATVGPIYGNDVILNGLGNANTTYYQVQVFTVSGGFISSTPSLQNFYAFTGSGTIDLATATPLVPNFMNSTAGVSIPGNLSVSGNFSTVGTSNIAIKPAASDAVQYISVNGNDSNDGFSMGSAKLTEPAACAALPGGASACSGYIVFGAGTFPLGTSGLQMHSNLHVTGNGKGSTILEINNASAGIIYNDSGGISHTSLTNLTIYSTTSAGNTTFIRAHGFNDPANFSFNDIDVDLQAQTPTLGSAGFFATSDGAANATQIILNNIRLTGTGIDTPIICNGCEGNFWNVNFYKSGLSNAAILFNEGTSAAGAPSNDETGFFRGENEAGPLAYCYKTTGTLNRVVITCDSNQSGTKAVDDAGSGSNIFDVSVVGTPTIGVISSASQYRNGDALQATTLSLASSGGGTITHQAPNTASTITVTDPVATTATPVVGSCTMTTTTCTITVVSGAVHCVAMDSGGTIAGQCAISGTTLTVTAASSNTSAWSVLWW